MEIVSSMINLEYTYSDLGRLEDALNLQDESLSSNKQVLTVGHPDIINNINNLYASY